MRLFKKALTGLAMALMIGTGAANAGTDLNEVGAFLVYPVVAAIGDGGDVIETFVTITNASANATNAHVSYINGDEESDEYCYECDFSIPLTGNDTEMLVVTFTAFGISIESEEGTVSMACPHPFGFITVNLEDNNQVVLTDNVLLGSEVVVNYTQGWAFSLSAIPFQGKSAGNGNRVFGFNDSEYGKLPRIVAADFIAPDLNQGPISAGVALFTLGFDRQHPPKVDCSVTGFDAAENPFSRSFQFGCWTLQDLCDIHPEFCYPNLGQLPGQLDTHGWFQFNCRVDSENNGSYEARGGVHGALLQLADAGAVIRRNDPAAPALAGAAAWARLLYQSVTTGDSVTLHIEEPGGGLN